MLHFSAIPPEASYRMEILRPHGGVVLWIILRVRRMECAGRFLSNTGCEKSVSPAFED